MIISTRVKAAALVIVLFVLPPLLSIGYYSYFNKLVIYLRGGGPPWMVNPEDQYIIDYETRDFPATYAVRFRLDSPPARGRVKLYATGSHVISVNGFTLSTEESTAKLNWKSGSEYNIAKYLIPGDNELSVYVRSPYSATALKVKGEAAASDGTTVPLGSSGLWTVRSEIEMPALGLKRDLNPATVVRYPSFAGRIRNMGYWPKSLNLFGAAGAGILLLLLYPGMFRRIDRAGLAALPGFMLEERSRKLMYRLSVAAIFTVLGVLLYHNIPCCYLPFTGDYAEHVNYVAHFLNSWRVPMATDASQMYNPPLLYILAANSYKLLAGMGVAVDIERPSQVINSLSAFFMTLMIFLILRRLFKDRLVVALTLAVAAFMPMSLYKAASISGESLGAFLASGSFYFWLRYAETPRRKFAALAGFFSALGFLTRFSAVIPFLAMTAGFAYLYVREAEGRKRLAKDYAVFAGVVAVLAGWFYVRNLIYLHTPFPIQGVPSLFYFREPPLFRDWHFFTNFTGIMLNTPIPWTNVTWSFPGGLYSTVWYDGMKHFIFDFNVPLIFTLFALALLPTLLMGWGVLRSSEDMLAGEGRASRLYGMVGVITVAVALAFYVPYILQVPNYGVINGSYHLYLLTPLAYFLAQGISGLTARSGRLVLSLWLAALCAVIVWLFYLPPLG